MAIDNSMKEQMEALETRIENRLQETLHDFKKSLLEHFRKFQQDGSSSSTLHRYGNTGKGPQDYDTNYSYIKVEFLRWEDGDPTSWIFKAENFFSFHRTPKESKVEVALIQLDGDVIQWYDWYETFHRVPSWEQFKRASFSLRPIKI